MLENISATFVIFLTGSLNQKTNKLIFKHEMLKSITPYVPSKHSPLLPRKINHPLQMPFKQKGN